MAGLLAEEDGGEPPAAGLGDVGHQAGGLEDDEQLLAGRLVVPGAVGLDDVEQQGGGVAVTALAGIGAGEVEAGLVVGRVGPEGGFQRGYLLDTAWHLLLPVVCISYGTFAYYSKLARTSLLETLGTDFVRTARAKGLPEKIVLYRHAFRNSLLPLITMFVSIFPAMLAGSVVIERIFSVPGMGTELINAITLRDRELILANTTMIVLVNLVALLLADILYALADPRVSYE